MGVLVVVPPVQAAAWFVAQQAMARRGGRRRPGPVAAAAGVALVGGAVATGVAALRRFVRRDTTWHPWDPERASTLVTDGPNSVTRNPMYLALATGLVGTGLLSGRPWTALAGLGLLGTLGPQVRREEAALAVVFGPLWEAYAARVPRWLA